MRKKLAILLSFIFIFCAGCFAEDSSEEKYGFMVPHPIFKTEYTEEEHIARLSARTEERFATEIESGEIVDFEIEIVYAFYDNDPEYFLVTLEYAEEFFIAEEKTTKYKYTMGIIVEDEYRYASLSGYMHGFKDGPSPYHYLGYGNAKKYYGWSRHAVATEEGVLLIYTSYEDSKIPVGLSTIYGDDEGYYFDYYYRKNYESFETRLVSEEEAKKWMRGTNLLFKKLY